MKNTDQSASRMGLLKCPMEDMELLERARRLCLAARQLELPVILPGVGRGLVEWKEESGDDISSEDVDGDGQSSSEGLNRGKLPLISAPAAVNEHKKAVNLSEEKEKLIQEETRRLEDEKKKHERKLEKVKQAQERARARVARTNQLEQQQTLHAAEQQQSNAVSAAEEFTEKIRRAQESRRRAKERIRMKRHEKTPDSTPPNAASGPGTDPARLKLFHRKTIKRLQSSSQQVIWNNTVNRADTPERIEEIDLDQKFMERKFRQETTARLRRMRLLAENQKRQEQEEFEQGLQKFKSKLRKMDRVAKGLSKQPSLPQIDKPAIFGTQGTREEIPANNILCSSPVQDELRPNQDEESSSDSDELKSAHSPASHPDRIGASSPRTAETKIRRSKSRCRLPAWKQPPVPILPTQCYSYQAIIPTYSRASVTAPGYSTAAALGSETRFRAQQIERQMK